MRQVWVIVFASFLAAPLAAQENVAAVEETADNPGAAVAEAVEEAPAPAIEPLLAADTTLEEFHWLSRPIVVFADSPNDPRFREQMKLLTSRPEELLERDVVVITDTDPGARSAIRTKLRPRGFMLTLIAKDGRVNLRKPFPWDVREITHAIDKWPIRQQEIRDAKDAAAAEAAGVR